MTRKIFYSVITLVFVIVTSFYSDNNQIQREPGKVRNVILLIGDGMGLAQMYAGYTANKGFLNITRCTVTGISKTNSANRYVTDSGAGATAISTGQKTYNERIAVDTTGKPLTTILEIAEKYGMSTGVAVTSSVTHATPAAFVAHVTSRKSQYDIALDFLKSDIDVFIGGGKKFFTQREDNKNLIQELERKDFSVVYKLDDAKEIAAKKLAVLAAEDSTPSMLKGRGDFLPNAVAISINMLNNNPKGFFLMVEGSQIDWAGHQQNIQKVTTEVIDFDKAVGVALDFAQKDGNTLVIITGDHETGGLSLDNGNISMGTLQSDFSNNHGHTGVPVPVYAFGPGAEKFTGFYENTQIFFKMIDALGIK